MVKLIRSDHFPCLLVFGSHHCFHLLMEEHS